MSGSRQAQSDVSETGRQCEIVGRAGGREGGRDGWMDGRRGGGNEREEGKK